MSTASSDTTLVHAERRLVDSLGLRPLSLQPRFAQARGLWKDAPVTLTTRAYEGDAASYVRIAILAGAQLSIGSLLVCARPNRGLPILAADLVRRGQPGETTVSATMVQTTDMALPERIPAAMRHASVPQEHLADALAAFEQYVESWIALGSGAAPKPEHAPMVRRRQQEHFASSRADPATRSLLAAMFGSAWAEAYMSEVLFPGALTDG